MSCCTHSAFQTASSVYHQLLKKYKVLFVSPLSLSSVTTPFVYPIVLSQGRQSPLQQGSKLWPHGCRSRGSCSSRLAQRWTPLMRYHAVYQPKTVSDYYSMFWILVNTSKHCSYDITLPLHISVTTGFTLGKHTSISFYWNKQEICSSVLCLKIVLLK